MEKSVSDKPQTTREKILGIFNTKEGQLLFLDTPGLHTPHKPLNDFMVAEAKSTIADADLIFYLVEPTVKVSELDLKFVREIEENNKSFFIVINKVDQVAKLDLLPIVKFWQEHSKAKEFFLISAEKKDGIETLIQKSLDYLPEGSAFYPDDQLTDRNLRYLASEIIREKLFKLTHQEVPYSVAVVIDEFKEEPKIDRISATIYVEKDSQKPIVIGKAGSMLKKVGQEARIEIENLTGKKAFLKIFVKVVKDWTKSEHVLKDLGYQ